MGITLLLLFSMGMGIPLVIGAMTMAWVLPLLFKMEKVMPWMGLGITTIIAGYAVLLMGLTRSFGLASDNPFVDISGRNRGQTTMVDVNISLTRRCGILGMISSFNSMNSVPGHLSRSPIRSRSPTNERSRGYTRS